MINKLPVLAILMILFSFSAANTATATDISNKATNVISYLGNIGSSPVFELKLDNVIEDEFEVRITDVNNHILHSETVKGNSISKKYKLDVDSDDLKNIRFVVKSKSTKEVKTYQIINNSYVVSNLVVANL
ncbi:hypothetical protein [Aridibaculum aurantiacum]|uniref:hypothetical protein n=1 Tax=Aridibaculum aurantiacum TaxID=2810307 RepID=UPI001A97499A|nr:hypothetical protein [Aridibaculum aurantiacum]